ncbi:hypothetical protein SY83_16605 [Paenibacillus swuensis]|uniref:Heparan-alpha-glucosaminide N-acetyltransferase catalytic domain-containing protein n=1 Tax=Paenibacillus swuensis TaxID=1178515 RepID=A0A172TLE4_9BACL|nr:acyltransferase family protein [Paenibacillus swuensis]ANE47637.1 hypothetical protein SY83_16605 [Paenibacillus swuensis]
MLSKPRLLGIDFARFVAILGMILVHAATDLVMLPQERALDAEVPWPKDPAWAYWIQVIFANRARPLFIMLAGVGISLLVSRKSIGGLVLVKRAAYLLVLGVLLLVAGWSDMVLCIYGIMFLFAVVLVRLPTVVLVILTCVLLASPLPYAEATEHDAKTIFSIFIVISQIGYFVIGMVIGRMNLNVKSAISKVAVIGAGLTLPGWIYLWWVNGSIQVIELKGIWDWIAANVSTVGWCFLVLSGCLSVGRSTGRISQWLAPFNVAGGMPLTIYVIHALLYTWLSHQYQFHFGQAMLISLAYIIFALIATNLWAAKGYKGPLEMLMRVVSGSSPSKPKQI